MRFTIEAKHEVRAVNPRREMHGEERVIALDIKLVGFVPMAHLPAILGVESAAELHGTLWDSETGDVTLPNCSTVKAHSDTRFEQLVAHVGGLKLTEAVARRFQGEPVNGGLEMTWLLTLPHPDPGTIGKLSEKIGETVKVTADSAQQDLGLAGQQGGEDEAAEAAG